MTRRRPATLVGSALPLLLVVGLVGLTPAQAATAAADDPRALSLLRRAVLAAASLAYSGTQVVSAWPASGGANTQLLEIRQLADGSRAVTAQDPSGDEVATTQAMVLGGLSARALAALVAAYELRVAGYDEVAGRAAAVVVAAREGREAARLWIDTGTGLLLREDVFDADGDLHRMAAFLDVRPVPAALAGTAAPTGAAAVPSGPMTTNAALTRRVPAQHAAGQAPAAWQEVGPAAARRWCPADTCPASLPGGFTLLDARRGHAEGAAVLHLLYGDGLSAISVFVQPGRLEPDSLAGLNPQRRAGHDVYAGAGWPDRLTWQGGPRVFTVISDAAPLTLNRALEPLPHRAEVPDGDAFASLRRGLQSVLGWLPGD